MMFETF